MKKQKGFSTVSILVIVLIVIIAGIYFFPKQALTPQTQDEIVPEETLDITIDTISESQIILSNGLILSIDEFPDEVDISPESTFGSSDRFKSAELSPNDEWLAIAIGGAAHDFGWMYNLETKELNVIAFQYGGGVEVKEWISDSQVVLTLETPEPKTIDKIVDVNAMTQYPN